MSDIKIIPSEFCGKIKVPSSKSICHRAIICAALSNGESKIKNITFSKDIISTIEAMKKLGAEIYNDDDTLIVRGLSFKENSDVIEINCNESGSTLRFLIPIVLLNSGTYKLYGEGRLPQRPIDLYFPILKKMGVHYKKGEEFLPIILNGKLKCGEYKIRGDVSSQFISGLLFALPLVEGESKLVITSPLESKGYVDLTLNVLKDFGINIEHKNYEEFYIKGNQKYTSRDYEVESDVSSAAFFMAAGVLNGNIELKNINPITYQPDNKILSILKSMGGNIEVNENNNIICKKSILNGVDIDVSECPDIMPILAVVGCFAEGVTRIFNAKRVRIKESDRLLAMYEELTKMGANINMTEDEITIFGGKELKGSILKGWNDHRIVMSLAIACSLANGESVISDRESVGKSYGQFFNDYLLLGGKCIGVMMDE